MDKTFTSALIAVMSINTLTARCAEPPRDYPVRPVPAHRVRFTDAFWQPRLEANRTATIPFSFQMCEETGRIENFKVAGGLSGGKWVGIAGFNDSDVFKVMEGAAYSLMTHPDTRLATYLDDLIGYIAAAQEDDGYLFTAQTARDRIADGEQLRCCYPRDGKKWLSLKDSHELYNLGHMYEAAVAHWEATGEEAFLNVARKSADLLVETFGPGKLEIPPGHQEVELALAKLYRATGNEEYLKLARYFLDMRGRSTGDRPELWGEYAQDHKPLTEQDEAAGHAVRAMYLYAGATDVAALTGDQALIATMNRLWHNVVGKKTYITGGIGATRQGEAFGKDYQLPNDTAYAETCASLAVCFWNHRLFLLHGDAKYIDVMERALYNGVLSGVALDGKTFFYPNPLASAGNHARSKWFDCACCPSNICRFIPSVPGYAYASRDDILYVNLFAEGSAEVDLSSGKVRLEQITSYPWEGEITIRVHPETDGQEFALHVRIPGWVGSLGQPLPGGLYRFLPQLVEQPTLTVNGKPQPLPAGSMLRIIRAWQPGDTVKLSLPMPVRRVVADENVEANRGRMALVRGPIVYCIEWPDVEGGSVHDLVLPDEAPLATEFRKDLLGGVGVITGTAQRVEQPVVDGEAAVTKPVSFTAIPYYAWAHRGAGEMAVWLPRTPNAVK